MPLPRPTLDNRTYDQLVDEGRAQIPRLAPRWTDHNASDPGITLLELFAWLAEQNIYRFDRLSDEAIRQFARLVGVAPLPPQVARTVVAIANANAMSLSLPKRMQLHDGLGPRFETVDAIDLTASLLIALGHGDQTGRYTDDTGANASLEGFEPLGPHPRAALASAFYLGFDQALDDGDNTLSIHVWTASWASDGLTRQALIDEQAAMADCPGQDPDAWMAHYRARVRWEFYAGGGHWRPLKHVQDETRALSLSGFVRFRAPVGHQPGARPDNPGLYFIRCRLVSGGYECPPRLLHVAVNAVTAEDALSRDERQIGVAAGHAGARFAFDDKPIVHDAVSLRIDNGSGDDQTDWTTRLDWDETGAHDRHLVLIPEDGELVSGNGLRGSVPPAGYKVFATYRVGGGEQGNIPEQSLLTLPPSAVNTALAPALAGLAIDLTLSQPFVAQGGARRETLQGLSSRAYRLAGKLDKAVTLQDFERLALCTPGVPVARAHAVANLSPRLSCYPAPGAVTVVVVPKCRLPAPMPSQAMLDEVAAYLSARRLVTSEVHVIPPDYRRVSVTARLLTDVEADAKRVHAWAIEAINQFFDPLTGGPDGTGWPIGRTVYRSEVMALLAALPGVVYVTEFGLLVDGPCMETPSNEARHCGCGEASPAGASSTLPAALCGNVELCAHELVRPGRHRLTVQNPQPTELHRSDPHECEHPH